MARGIPAGVDDVVLRVGRGDRRGETEKFRLFGFASGGLAAEFGVLSESLGADVGGVQEGMTPLKAEVVGGLVAEEFVGAGNDGRAGDGHSGEIGLGSLRSGSEFAEPVESPFERADDAVGVAGGKGSLPLEHPFGVKAGEHKASLAIRFSKRV